MPTKIKGDGSTWKNEDDKEVPGVPKTSRVVLFQPFSIYEIC